MTEASVTQNYNPGRATVATKNADGTWSVPSFRGEERVYIVNLELRSCSCPHHQNRQAVCKHILTAAEQSTYIEYLEKARRCEDGQLEKLLARYLDDPMISGAIRMVRAERKQRAQEDAALRAIFA